MLWFLQVNSWQELLIGFAVRLLIIFLVLPVHECAHGWMANKLGDDTALRMGRLTLNPLAHIDWLGAACIILVGFGWAKPVPVNPYRFDNQAKRKRGMALTALAGPVSNLLVAIISMILLRAIFCFPVSGRAASLIMFAFQWLYSINISLAVFNLLPIYPLDGSRIIGGVLPDRWNNFLERNSRVISIITMVILFGGLLDPVINFLYVNVFNGIWFCIDGLFGIFGL